MNAQGKLGLWDGTAMTLPTATVIHLSDLHLGKDFKDVGTTKKASFLSHAKYTIKHGGISMQAHEPNIVLMLPLEIRSAERYMNAREDEFDLCFVTGDISTTAGSKQRFKFAERYLTSKVRIDKKYNAGLNMSGEKLLCVIGNHDRYDEESPERYLSVFGKYPDTLPYVKKVEIPNSKQKFLIYGIDSNVYEGGNVAKGKIYPETLQWLGEQFDNSSSILSEDDLIIRVLILHHHPADLNRFRRRSLEYYLQRLIMRRFTLLDEGERLLDLCNAHIDLILHGHEHFPVVFSD